MVVLNRHFSKEEMQMSRYVKKKKNAHIRGLQINTARRYHLTPLRLAVIKMMKGYKCWQGCGEKETVKHCWWRCKLVQLHRKQYGGSLEN